MTCIRSRSAEYPAGACTRLVDSKAVTNGTQLVTASSRDVTNNTKQTACTERGRSWGTASPLHRDGRSQRFVEPKISLRCSQRYLSSHTQKQTPWPESDSELYRQSDCRFSAELAPTFGDRGCHVVSVTDPYGRNLGFLDRCRYFFFQVAP
jgi:hypothetical protein